MNMDAEKPTTDQGAQAAVESTISAADVRNHDLFKKLAADLAAQRQAVADMQAAQAEAKKVAERKAMEEAQNWDGLKASMAADHEAAIAKVEAELVAERLTNKLVLAGVSHPFAITAAKAQYVPGEKSLDEFVAEFIATDEVKALLKPTTALPGGSAAAAAARSTDSNWTQVLEDKNSDDPKRKMEAARKVKQFMIENNGKRPPGF